MGLFRRLGHIGGVDPRHVGKKRLDYGQSTGTSQSGFPCQTRDEYEFRAFGDAAAERESASRRRRELLASFLGRAVQMIDGLGRKGEGERLIEIGL
jgi:hypothetical protein